MADTPASTQLRQLLADLFSVDEARRFAQDNYPELADAVYWDQAKRTVITELVEKLDGDGLVDAKLFDALETERSAQAEYINHIRRVWLGDDAKSGRRRWVWRCTPETEEALVPSVLAVVETVVAMAAYVWAAIKFSAYDYIAISGVIAPLILTRTEASIRIGLRLARRLNTIMPIPEPNNRIEKRWHLGIGLIAFIAFGTLQSLSPFLSDIQAALTATAIIISSIAVPRTLAVIWTASVRAVATLIAAWKRPLASAQAIPRNWYRVTFCHDGFHHPELIPGMNSDPAFARSSYNYYRYYLAAQGKRRRFDRASFFYNKDGARRENNAFFVQLPIWVGWLIAWFYRFSIKGTSLIWLPLIWAVNPARGDKVGPRGVLHDVRYGLISQLARWYSVFIFGVAVFKVLLFINWPTWQSWWLQYTPELIHEVIAPTSLPLWQIAALINTIGLWLLTFWADRAVRHPTLYKEATIDKVLRSTLTIRRLLTLFTTVSVLWILIEVAELGRVLAERVG